MSKLRIAAVKYLNTLPMLHGLRNSLHADKFSMELGHPSECARMLFDREVDIALCPVGALIDIEEYHLVSRYGIACKGPVRTVSIYSDAPLQELKKIKLYDESRSSNILARVLERNYWKTGLEFIASDDVETDLSTGYLVIGDACFEHETKFQYITDLGDAWFNMTGLPFLFACWVSLHPISDEIQAILNTAFKSGIADLNSLDLPKRQAHVDLYHYLKDNIRYEIDDETVQGMNKFVSYARELHVSSPDVAQTSSRQSI